MTRHTDPSARASMHDGVTAHADDDALHNPDVAHEHHDINVGAIVWSGVMLFVVCGITAVLMYGTFVFFANRASRNEPPVSPLAAPPTQMPPTTTASPFFGAAPQPKLLANEPALLQERRGGEAKRLQGYGWVDEGAGAAHVPIEEAKKLIVERGLPVRADAADPGGFFSPAEGEASGGRMLGASKPIGGATEGKPAPPPAAKPHGH